MVLPLVKSSKRYAKTQTKHKQYLFTIKSIFIAILIIYCLVILITWRTLRESKALHVTNNEQTPHIGEKQQQQPPSTATTTSDESAIRYHLVFSTDCSDYQHWQSYLLFYTAYKVRQPGRVTRIASGCNQQQMDFEKQWHETHVKRVMSDRFGIHFTPDFTKESLIETKEDYHFFNKPFGLRHWMEHGCHIGTGDGADRKIDDDAIVILLDPDMILLRPITHDDFDNEYDIFASPKKAKKRLGPHPTVAHGTPIAQLYGYDNNWQKRNISRIAGPHSPALRISPRDGGPYYAAGPPYIVTAKDMYELSQAWTAFVPKVHEEFPYLMAEMYAYSIAAGHLTLPHWTMTTLMVSEPDNGGEGWSMLMKRPGGNLTEENVCRVAFRMEEFEGPLPRVLHYCQRYIVGKWFFTKPSFPRNFLSCETPLLEVPPMDIAVQFDYREPPPPHPRPGEKQPMTKDRTIQESFALCRMIAVMNELGTFYKDHHCRDVEGTRWDKSMNQWTLGDYKGQNYTFS